MLGSEGRGNNIHSYNIKIELNYFFVNMVVGGEKENLCSKFQEKWFRTFNFQCHWQTYTNKHTEKWISDTKSIKQGKKSEIFH